MRVEEGQARSRSWVERCALFLGGSLVPVWSLALLLFAVAETRDGRTTAAAFLFTAPAFLLGAGALLGARVPARRRILVGLLSVGFLASSVAAMVHLDVPSPEARSGAIESVWWGAQRPVRLGPSRWVPERDQFALGGRLVIADPFVDGDQAARIRSLFGAVYDEGHETPGFRALGGSMPHAYRELLGGTWRSDHAFVQVPDGPGPHPVVLFAHGSGGNFKGYQVVLGALRERGVAVVSPSFGFGNWYRDGGVQTLERALDRIGADPRLDGARVGLVGLSNGGFAVSRGGPALAPRLCGVAWVSGVVETARLDGVGRAFRGRPVALLHGAVDRRIPAVVVDRAADLLAGDVHLRVEVVPDEDHFLFFSDRTASVDFLEAWARDCFAGGGD